MIEVTHLTKCYGDFKAVDDLSFEIDEGHVYGFLGPNGAGKSTTMNMMTGCLSATEGHVRIDGCDIFEEPLKAKKLIGYLPEQPPLYMNETPDEYLRFVGEAKGLRGDLLREEIEDVIRQTGLSAMRARRISALSKGYKQRVGIAQALLGNPRVIILDEPTVGLDPIQIIEIRDLIRELGKSHTVIFSSHILSEVQTICDQVLIIAKGHLIAYDKTENLERLLSKNELTITAETDEENARRILTTVSGVTIEETGATNAAAAAAVTEHRQQSTFVLTADGADMETVCREVFFAFADARVALLEMRPRHANLEEIFIELTEGDAGTNDFLSGVENAATDGQEADDTDAKAASADPAGEEASLR